MRRVLEVTAAFGLLLLVAPILLSVWLTLKGGGTRPVFVINPHTQRGISNQTLEFNCPSGIYGSFLRGYAMERLPTLFLVLTGKTRLSEAMGWMLLRR